MLIEREKSIIPACDVRSLEVLQKIVATTCSVEGIGGYKVGITLALRFGLPCVVSAIREFTDKPVIYDHQKAGNDIPDLGLEFAEIMVEAGVDAAILFPFAGPVTLTDWHSALSGSEVTVMVGGRMTHKAAVEEEGGWVAKWFQIYDEALKLGVTDLVVPGNKMEVVEYVLGLCSDYGGGRNEAGCDQHTLYAPGFVAQGGSISEAAKVAGSRWHAIVGRGITKADDYHEAALELTQQL